MTYGNDRRAGSFQMGSELGSAQAPLPPVRRCRHSVVTWATRSDGRFVYRSEDAYPACPTCVARGEVRQ